MEEKKDWRLTNQENYLKNQKMTFEHYALRSNKWDHDHCEFCMKKFSDNDTDLHEGYCTLDRYHWICKDCYNDFKDMFVWEIIVDDSDT